ncbi:Acetyltransferase (GNAT) family protein [Macrococcoides canis]|uniref:Acetyltransferase (GNAT) family protein n=1 Tax=Macrococcoides canis TaxID=1855823 RepID=A0A1W7A841_9STAP|nr:GNAT family N-acetyltransferase [Macrococcus canis]ARQ05789.1 Acetyltransferase (GNAT) family protein [Macrococcus canis]
MHLEEVSESNIEDVIKLDLKDSQKMYVATNLRSIADAYIYRNEGVCPFAVKKNDIVVGFIMFDRHDTDESTCIIWRMMIGHEFQGNGYGKEMIKLAKKYAKERGYNTLMADYVKGNNVVRSLLISNGFVERGIDNYNQVIMSIEL